MPDPDYSAVFSIDVEDWYQGIELPLAQWAGREKRVHVGLDTILGLLSEHKTRGTFFILGWIAERYPEIVRRIAEQGHEIASHGYAHEKVYGMTRDQFREDIRRTKGLLESIAASPVVAHRSPFFSITRDSLWALEVLRQEGYLYDCSISPVRTWRYGIDGSPAAPYRIKELGLVEFPVSTGELLTRKFAIGGAYFRIFPYFLTERGIQRLISEGAPFMFYAHPWEYDPDHPVIDAMDRRAKLTHYFNLGATAPRTARLLKSCRFRSLSEVIEFLDARQAIPELSLETLKS